MPKRTILITVCGIRFPMSLLLVDAFRIEKRGILSGLKSTALRGAVVIDPRRQDFFKIVIEERKRLASHTSLSDADKELLDKSLKGLANAASYGIYAQMDRRELEKESKCKVLWD